MIALIHTLAGPDHYLPFIVLARSRKWSLARTLGITAICGLGHVCSSIILGLIGIALGIGVQRLSMFESWRGDLAAWFLAGFGLVYLLWGIRRARKKTQHDHQGKSLTPWLLFVAFLLGPCEPLIPLLMYPALQESWFHMATVAGLFGVVTIATMLVVVAIGYRGLKVLPKDMLGGYAHAFAGAAILGCAIAIHLGL
jgi:sulfite exporter TauE/SafE